MLGFEGVARYLVFSKQVTHFYQVQMDRAARESGVSRPESDVLLFLSNSPQLDTARDVCEYRGLSKAYVSKAVEQLVRRGFLQAQVSREDRRVQVLTVLSAAEETVKSLQAGQLAFFRTVTEGMTEEEARILEAAMRRVAENVKRCQQQDSQA